MQGRQRASGRDPKVRRSMSNVMEIGGHRAVIQFDPEAGMFRGEFLGLNGGADFYADSVAGLHKEGEASLRVFLEMCAENNVRLDV